MEELTTKKAYELKKFVRKLESIKARHTELISVYIPKGYILHKITQHLDEEKGTASNIKSKQTKTNVVDALEKITRHLQTFKQTPENGLAVFAGNISQTENKVNIEVFSVEPPQPLQSRLYRCDQTFILDFLKDQLEHKDTYGLIVLDKREATIGFLNGTTITATTNLTSGVPGKYKTGGQSSARFARLREEAAHVFYDRIADAAKKEFYGKSELKGILIGGPGPTKQEFNDGDFLITELKAKVLGLKDITYTDEFGLQNLVDKSEDLLQKQAYTKERELLSRFFELLGKETEKTAYGIEKTKKALEYGAVEILILTESLEEDDVTDELEELASNTGAETEYVSEESQEGIQFKNLG